MEKIRNLSIRKTIVLYMTVNLIVCFFLSAAIMLTAEKTQNAIWQKYIDMGVYYQAQERSMEEENKNYEAVVPRVSRSRMSDLDGHISELCDFLETYSILVISWIGTIITVILFYKKKIRVPLTELKQASQLISQDELDFTITYSNKDELGQLCREFEKMRKQLMENNKQLWKMVEQEKALRSAIAHDIRSPLAIMKGYQEILLEFVPDESLDKGQILEMLDAGMKQIGRMDAFINAMQKLAKLEDREMKAEENELEEFAKQCQQNADVLGKKAGKDCAVYLRTKVEKVWFDPGIVYEVLDNLVSNALRYAREKAEVIITAENNKLILAVTDDGEGFKEGTETLTKACYHANPQGDLNHFGLGLYISRIYCEKHGGRLLLQNAPTGGAHAVAEFGKCVGGGTPEESGMF